MDSVTGHYENLLAKHYTWAYGGWDAQIAANCAYFGERGLSDGAGKIAFDLGAGSGFQSVPLAEAGYNVFAIDLSATLLEELRGHAQELPVTCIEGDIAEFDVLCPCPADLIVCMTDTILHLPSREAIIESIAKISRALKPGGHFVVSFRDLSIEPSELDRIVPVRSDDDAVFTCVLEYEPEHVKVFDLLYTRDAGNWTLQKGFYRKVRASLDWIKQSLDAVGLQIVHEDSVRGMNRLVVMKPV